MQVGFIFSPKEQATEQCANLSIMGTWLHKIFFLSLQNGTSTSLNILLIFVHAFVEWIPNLCTAKKVLGKFSICLGHKNAKFLFQSKQPLGYILTHKYVFIKLLKSSFQILRSKSCKQRNSKGKCNFFCKYLITYALLAAIFFLMEFAEICYRCIRKLHV